MPLILHDGLKIRRSQQQQFSRNFRAISVISAQYAVAKMLASSQREISECFQIRDLACFQNKQPSFKLPKKILLF